MSAGTKEHDAKAWLFCGCLIFLSGCGTSVTVATRLDPNHSMWSRLDGPSYAIVAEDQRVEATLAFRAYASIVEQALSSVRPGLERKGSASEAGLVLTLVYDAADLGSAVASYPVYGYQYGYFYGCPSGFYRTYGYIGTETYTYHLGYRHSLILSAWVQEANAPAGRHVIWEGAYVCKTTTRWWPPCEADCGRVPPGLDIPCRPRGRLRRTDEGLNQTDETQTLQIDSEQQRRRYGPLRIRCKLSCPSLRQNKARA